MNLKDFVKNSSIIFISTIIGGVFSFAFHPIVARFLTIKEFAELEALFSLSVILGVPSATLGLIIIRYVSKFYAKKDFAQIRYLRDYFFKIVFYGGIAVFLLFLMASPYITAYLKMDSVYPVLITGILMVLAVIGGIFIPILNGMQKFKSIGTLAIIGAISRFVIGVGFAIIFMSLYGVLGGIVVQSVFIIFIAFWFVNRYLKDENVNKANSNFKIRDYGYYIRMFFIVLSLTAFYNMDVMLVKNIFPIEQAAIYASVAVIAKAIVFAASALEGVMFPVVIGKYEQNKDFLLFFIKTAIILITGLIFSVAVFYFFGKYFIMLMGEQYLAGAEYLWKMAIFIALFAMVNYLAKFLLAVKQTFIVYILGFGAIIQIIFGYLFSEKIDDFISGMSYAMLCTLILLIIFFVKNKKKLALSSLTEKIT